MSNLFRKIVGPSTGSVYECPGRNSRVRPTYQFEEEDVEGLLQMTEKKGCCGQKRTQALFERV